MRSTIPESAASLGEVDSWNFHGSQESAFVTSVQSFWCSWFVNHTWTNPDMTTVLGAKITMPVFQNHRIKSPLTFSDRRVSGIWLSDFKLTFPSRVYRENPVNDQILGSNLQTWKLFEKLYIKITDVKRFLRNYLICHPTLGAGWNLLIVYGWNFILISKDM